MDQDLSYKLTKYIAQGIIIFALFKYIPNETMKDTDILLVTIIAILVYAVLENLYSYYYGPDGTISSSDSQFCNTRCAIPKQPLEHMGNYDSVITNGNNAEQTVQGFEQVSQQLSPMQQLINGTKLDNNTGTASNDSNATVRQNADGSYTFEPSETIQGRSDGIVPSVTENNYTDLNNFPMGSNVNSGSFEYGYSFLPPEKWYPVPPHPPVCISETKCPVCPTYTPSEYANLKEWDASRKVTPPSGVNV
jgi:hypothetical protein